MTGRKKKLAVFLCLTMLLSVYTPLVSSAAAFPSVGVSVNTNQAVKIVSTQKELESALAKASVKQIVIKTGKETGFEIPKGSYSGKKLVVRAPKAEIKNAGSFKNVTIYSVSDRGYVENADDNRIRVLALSGRIVVPAGKTVDSLAVTRKNSRVKIEVSGTVRQMDVKKASNLAMEVTGSIKRMNVNATSTIMMTGNSKDTTIIVNKAAKNSRITVSAPATVKLKASATVILKSGAENARLVVPKSSAKAVSYTLVNETNSTLRLNTSTGTKMLATGKSYNGKESGSSNTTITGGGSGGSSGGSGGSSGGGGSTTKPQEPEKPEKKVLPVAAEMDEDLHTFYVYADTAIDALTVTVASGKAAPVTASAGAVEALASPKVFYKDGKPERVYGYRSTCSLGEGASFDQNTDYTVALGETEDYRFEALTMNAEPLKDKLEPYEAALRDAFEEVYFEVKETDTVEQISSEINERIEYFRTLAPPFDDRYSIAFKNAYNFLESGSVVPTISAKAADVNGEYPLCIRLQKGEIIREFECGVILCDINGTDGKLWSSATMVPGSEEWTLQTDTDGKSYYDLSSLTGAFGWYASIDSSSWKSSSPFVEVKDAKAYITTPPVGAVKVTLTADIALKSDASKKTTIKRTVTLDSGLRMPEYTVSLAREDTGALKASATKQSDASGAQTSVSDEVRYQWYRIPAGSTADMEEIAGATTDSYMPGANGETGTYWYCCKLTSSYGGMSGSTNDFYSDFVKISVDKTE